MTDEEILKAFNLAREKEIRNSVTRPAFQLHKELVYVIISSVICLALIIVTACFRTELSALIFVLLLISEILLLFVTQSKRILLLLIFLYQRFAPSYVRGACLFTPSCSEYMRLSLLKYGVCKGFIKGLRRIRRCHPPNGGIDEP